MNTAFVFPGQGSQSVGMGKELYENFSIAKNIFHEVDDSLGLTLSKIIFEGPLEDLTLTKNTQPALMATSIAFLAVILHESGKDIADLCKYVAGHSVGEYAALTAAKSISIEDTAKLLKARGLAMQNSSSGGAMAASLGLSIEALEEVVKAANEYGICDIANDNSSSQVVISGEEQAIDFAIIKIKESGGKGIKLNVSGPFHSRLMKDAQNTMQRELGLVTIQEPVIPIVLNVTASESMGIDEIKASLVSQVAGRVRWRETMQYLANKKIDTIVEIGPGKVLNNMLKKESHSFNLINVGNIAELENFLGFIA